MRVRYEMYQAGHGTGYQAECNLDVIDAAAMMADLYKNKRCGWAELVWDEDDNEYWKYMDVMGGFNHESEAKQYTHLNDVVKKSLFVGREK